VSKATAMFLQKAWSICNAYICKHCTFLLLMFLSPPLRGAGPMASLMLGHSESANKYMLGIYCMVFECNVWCLCLSAL
jgi:hypothetical protein